MHKMVVFYLFLQSLDKETVSKYSKKREDALAKARKPCESGTPASKVLGGSSSAITVPKADCGAGAPPSFARHDAVRRSRGLPEAHVEWAKHTLL